MDATQEETDIESFAVLEPIADGFRNYTGVWYDERMPAEHLLVDKADLMSLTAPEMTVLVGGMRALTTEPGEPGCLTERPGVLTADFFVNLLDMANTWGPDSDTEQLFTGRDRASGEPRWTGTRVDLVFGSSSQLRALAEVYACADGQAKFVGDFVAA